MFALNGRQSESQIALIFPPFVRYVKLDRPLQAGVSAVDTPSLLCLFHCVVLLDVKRKKCFFLKGELYRWGVGEEEGVVIA